MVLESKFGSPRIVNDGVTVAKEVELQDPIENVGAKLVRQVRPSCSMSSLLAHLFPTRDGLLAFSWSARWEACSAGGCRARLLAETRLFIGQFPHAPLFLRHFWLG